jgi:hypothetical protein
MNCLFTKMATPTENDVVSGSGKKAMNHRGNKVYRDMVNSLSQEKDSPRRIAEWCVNYIVQHGGRFLKYIDEDDYDLHHCIALSREEAIGKTTQAVRDARRMREVAGGTRPRLVENSCCGPSDKDVLSGPGKNTMNHPGNKRFLQLVKRYSKNKDERIGESIVDTITRSGGRFLRRQKGDTGTGTANQYWYVLSREQAILKAAQAIRDCRSRQSLIAAAKTRFDHEQHHVEPLEVLSISVHTWKANRMSDNRLSLLQQDGGA